MPTVVGLAFLAVSVYGFTRGSSYLFGLLIFSIIFQASTIFTSSAFGLQPYYLVAAFFLARCLLELTLNGTKLRTFGGMRLILAFAVLGVLSAAVYPLIFSGTRVLVSSEYGLGFTQGQLHPTSENLIQACFLFLNATIVLVAGCLPGSIEPARKGVVAAFYLLAAILVIQFACLVVHIPFPYALIDNNQHYALANARGGAYTRPNGTFSEPSGAGVLLSALALGFLANYVTTGRSKWKALAAFGTLLIVSSSGSFVAIALGVGLLVLRYPIVRFPFYVRVTRVKRLGFLIVLAACVLGSLAIPAVRDNLLRSTIEKGGSYSAAVRLGMDVAALQSVIATHGIGVGLGSSRPASFIVALLSSVGIPGTILFFAMVFRLCRNDLGGCNWMKWLLTGLILAMAAGDPDLSTPILWCSLAFIARASQPRNSLAATTAEGTTLSLTRLKRIIVGSPSPVRSIQQSL